MKHPKLIVVREDYVTLLEEIALRADNFLKSLPNGPILTTLERVVAKWHKYPMNYSIKIEYKEPK